MNAPAPTIALDAATRTARWRFPLLLALCMALLVALYEPLYRGDIIEYTLDTVAIADHGTPDIRLENIAATKALVPDWFDPAFDQLERGMRAGEPNLYAAFARGQGGAVYPVHFFGYSLLAAVPFKIFAAAGADPFKAFLVVNLTAVLVLGLALRRFFGSEAKAFAGLALFMLCGGALYWQWTSPECVSAALLLAGLLFYTSGAPLRGALLAGLASQQNPTIVFFFAFAPLIKLCLDHQAGQTWRTALRAQANKRNLIGLALGAAVFSLPPLFNLVQYGVPNLIAKRFSDAGLVSAERLLSFFLDPNQGMIIGLPGLLIAVLAWRRSWRVLAACLLFTLALAVPALAILNWNSDAAGMMRYAFWASMPLLFILLASLRARAWPRLLVAGVAALQAGAMVHAASYSYIEFSPAATWLMEHAPRLYHPEPEIFAERLRHNDDYLSWRQAYSYRVDGRPLKTLVHAGTPEGMAALCGRGGGLPPGNVVTGSTRGWIYVEGEVRCDAGGHAQKSFQYDAFLAGAPLVTAQGWSAPEATGPGWEGMWSNGASSRLVLQLDGLRPAALLFKGHYLDNQGRTRITVNGHDLGWHRLDHEPVFELPQAARRQGLLEIGFEHENPRSLNPADPRRIALFLREVSVRAP
jgi:hypothetical protein